MNRSLEMISIVKFPRSRAESSRAIRSTVIVALLFLAGCKSTPPPVPPPPPPPPPPPQVEVQVDDIPLNATPAVRAHLIRIREMRDLGQISEGQYQSRRALLLQQP